MQRRFVIEAVMLAIYGQLVVPGRQVEYVIPYSTILELYDLLEGEEPLMMDKRDDAHARKMVGELIKYFEEPFHRKKLERIFVAPWKKSSPFLINDQVTLTIVNAIDQAQYGEAFDPVETELLLTAVRENCPLLTDQLEFQDKIIEAAIPVHMYDIEDFEYALEDDAAREEMDMT